MTTLPEFLIARYDEDQAGIESSVADDFAPSGWLGPHLRMLEAQRAVIDLAREYSPELEHGDNGEWAFDATLLALVQPYADHPDFDAGWVG